MPSTSNLTIYQGEEAVYDATVSLDGSAYDLTGATTTDLTVKVGVRGNESVISLEIGSGISLTTAASGEMQITFSATQTDDLTPGKVYDWELWLDDGTYESPVIVGKVNVRDTLHIAG